MYYSQSPQDSSETRVKAQPFDYSKTQNLASFHSVEKSRNNQGKFKIPLYNTQTSKQGSLNVNSKGVLSFSNFSNSELKDLSHKGFQLLK